MSRAQPVRTALRTSVGEEDGRERRWRLKKSIQPTEGIPYRSTCPAYTGVRLRVARGLWPISDLRPDRKEPPSDRLSATWRYNLLRHGMALRTEGQDRGWTCRVTSAQC